MADSGPKWGNPNHSRAGLEMLEFDIDDALLTDVFHPIEQAIASGETRLKELPKDPVDDREADWAEDVGLQEWDLIEELIGMAFVAVQTYASRVRASAARLSRIYEKHHGKKLFVTGGDVLNLYSPIISGSPFTEVEGMNAVANYWKHRDEWNAGWSNLTGQQQKTADRIRAIGLEPGHHDNLRRAAKAFGVGASFGTLEPIRVKARKWAGEIYTAAEAKIR